ncbi:hypothetical protein GCM10010140_64470 [Streptosporangium pseudovulgare]|uniref:Uncharacterized protein n=1 Tax=Streptosporangium pseudovulgare TaxID=35765 RepID=A0ABQ2RGZ7_9ACTN|nr:hypothetical protein GCM10010140_64470 [Streptosporangium pseudovulgare]
MSVTEFFEKEKGHLPLVVLQVLQHLGHANAEFSPSVSGTETGRLQKEGVLGGHNPIVPADSSGTG